MRVEIHVIPAAPAVVQSEAVIVATHKEAHCQLRRNMLLLDTQPNVPL
jgi:hypothetical protein